MTRIEADVSAEIQEALDAIGVMVERVQCGAHRVRGGYLHCAKAGTPDLWTEFGWLEVKRDGKAKCRASQELWHARAHRHGVRVAVVSSVAEALAVVREWRKSKR